MGLFSVPDARRATLRVHANKSLHVDWMYFFLLLFIYFNAKMTWRVNVIGVRATVTQDENIV